MFSQRPRREFSFVRPVCRVGDNKQRKFASWNVSDERKLFAVWRECYRRINVCQDLFRRHSAKNRNTEERALTVLIIGRDVIDIISVLTKGQALIRNSQFGRA